VGAVSNVQGNPDFSSLQGKWKLAQKIGEFKKSEVKVQCVTEEGTRFLVPVIGRFEKLRVREMGIPQYLSILLQHLALIVKMSILKILLINER